MEEMDDEDQQILKLDEEYDKEREEAQADVDAASFELAELRRNKAEVDEKMADVEGPCLEEFRAVCDACHFQRQKWHGGAPNGPDCLRFLAASRYFVEILKPRFIQPSHLLHFSRLSASGTVA